MYSRRFENSLPSKLKRKLTSIRFVQLLLARYRQGDWRIPFSQKRKSIRDFIRKNNVLSQDLVDIGNYQLPRQSIESLAGASRIITVVSLGLGQNVTFDEEIKKIFPKCRLIGVEPSGENMKYCQSKKIFDDLIKAAICTAQINDKHHGDVALIASQIVLKGQYSQYELDASSRNEKSIRLITPTELIRTLGLDHIDILKIDIEGAAIEIICEFIEKFKSNPPRIIAGEIEPFNFNARAIHHSEYIEKMNSFFEYLNSCGYKIISTTDTREKYKYLSVEFFAAHSSVEDFPD